jgi:CheY-like chemotaxis protein
VRQSDGSITIDSESGRGTRVVILLPRARRAASAGPAEGQTEAGAFSARVLIVEDNDGVAAAVSEMIADLGHHPRRVANADEALNIFDTEAFDIVFSDIVMPGMGGIELAREIRRRRPDFPVLLTTGYADASVAVADPVLHKPYQSHELQQALHAALAARATISRSWETVRAPA